MVGMENLQRWQVRGDGWAAFHLPLINHHEAYDLPRGYTAET